MTTILFDIAQQLSARTEFSSLAMERARDAVIDTLGCMIAGTKDASVAAVTAAFGSEISGGGSRWLVTGGYASPSVAALVNGTAAHALDFDDNFHPGRAHASAVLVPALLATIHSQRPISGKPFLEAYLTGLEAQAAVGFGVNPSHYNRGWHGTSTVGAIGTTAGVARLLGANIEETAQAMSLAISMASGPKGQFGTPAKPLHAGIAARNAVEAALLAMSGSGGRLDILERPQGFLDLFGGGEAQGWADWRLDEAHIIETRGLVTKRHPCCASTHRAIDALFDLKQEYRLSAGEIDRIDVKVGISAARNLAYPRPENEMQARFSMPYCLARAMLQDTLSLSNFAPAALRQADVLALMSRIEMHSYTSGEEYGHDRLPHVLTVTLRDGTGLSSQRLHAKGSIEAPLDAGQRRSKFFDCARWGSGHATDDLYDNLLDLSQSTSVSNLLNLLAASS
ncbi:MmgE/PrpD family protein [Neorhizobium sp. T25_27]|uniref:MmgE/PrpD family protein n=1 Tax=Neorhizobium sp. T25_27 TaxID=2093831 RepID=UPI000CF91BE6|nr:MmgE/PrpD family protein [Neorhizobium sp. T25_27]